VTLGGKETMEQPESKEAAERASGLLERIVSGLVKRTEKLAVEAATYRHALKEVKEWYDRDGSVGGCSLVMETVEKALAANEKAEPQPPTATVADGKEIRA